MAPRRREPRATRIADADRERAATRLNEAVAEGRITIEELDERLDAVYAARFAADLNEVLGDLPGGDVVLMPGGSADSSAVLELRVGASGIRRSGDWTVPPQIRVKGAMGSVMLDFCGATIKHPVVEVELALGSGSALLLLPKGATASVDAVVANVGAVKSTVKPRRAAGAPHFVVSGRTRLGSVSVRRGRGFAGLRF